MNHRFLTMVAGCCLAAWASHAHASPQTYHVVETFNQVVYDASHPDWDTLFTGSFDYDPLTRTVSNLQGSLSQAMSGNTTFRDLRYQLSSVYDATLGGFIVTTFFQDSTDVFLGGGFAPGGMKTFGNQNASATIFVNADDPTAALTAAQIDRLAYADCTDGGLMGKTSPQTCMTGWVNHAKLNLAGGTMQGTYPISQTITAAVPEPASWALMLAGAGTLVSLRQRRRHRVAA
jgi:hypothetical protein